MKKEAVIAIILGILLGLGGASFLILKATPPGSDKVKFPQLKENLTPVEKNDNVVLLEVTSPEKGTLTDKPSITIKGKAQKGGLIVMESAIKDLAFTNEKQEFSTNFPLALGENKILVSVYDKNSKIPPQQKEIKVYYLDEE